jgi:hypothetical protein
LDRRDLGFEPSAVAVLALVGAPPFEHQVDEFEARLV